MKNKKVMSPHHERFLPLCGGHFSFLTVPYHKGIPGADKQSKIKSIVTTHLRFMPTECIILHQNESGSLPTFKSDGMTEFVREGTLSPLGRSALPVQL